MNPACPACAGETALAGWDDAFGFECQGCRAHVIRANSVAAFLTKHEEAIRYLEHLERVREARSSRRELRCPDCRAGNYRVLETSEVEVDACSGCGGLFLDPGEATQYLENLRNLPPPQRLLRTFAAKRRLNDEIIAMMWNLFF
jgi:Zn-finger nucleic acid-binding protein